jgi:hypothetical protein
MFTTLMRPNSGTVSDFGLKSELYGPVADISNTVISNFPVTSNNYLDPILTGLIDSEQCLCTEVLIAPINYNS